MSTANQRVAIVTGASRGIGRAIASELAAQNHAVLLTWATKSSGAEETVAEIEAAGGRALAVQVDVRQPADLDRAFDAAMSRFGGLELGGVPSGSVRPPVVFRGALYALASSYRCFYICKLASNLAGETSEGSFQR